MVTTWSQVYFYSKQKAQLSPRDRAMRRFSWNLANCHATVQKLLIRQVLNKSKLWSWRVNVGRCVINTCTQPWRTRYILWFVQYFRRYVSGEILNFVVTTSEGKTWVGLGPCGDALARHYTCHICIADLMSQTDSIAPWHSFVLHFGIKCSKYGTVYLQI